MKILVYAKLEKEMQSELEKHLPDDAEVLFASDISEQEVKEAWQSAEVLIGNPPADWFEETPGALKFWQLENVGFEQYKEVDYKGKTANVGDISAVPCAETIVSGILAFYRGIPKMVRNQVKKEWVGEKSSAGLQILSGKKVIILGSGAIGEHVNKLLQAFGCSTQMTAKSDPQAEIHSFDHLLQQLTETDLVVNTLPGNLDKYVSQEFFDAMKEGSLYANVGRGNTTDEAALINALESGKLTGAVLDVTEKEPLAEDSPLWEMENVILTQHTGAEHAGRDQDKVEKFISNIRKYLNHEEIEDEVKLSEGY
ncbi:D-2-hydroxyacid dehydrogenase [Dyadobacter sediminis]|nr:D-2-hydroxyacid dehydrogenase [Dyadobacter sediminis]GGC06950.1 dihydrofolate reductase [Dyadobacter sediminis]